MIIQNPTNASDDVQSVPTALQFPASYPLLPLYSNTLFLGGPCLLYNEAYLRM